MLVALLPLRNANFMLRKQRMRKPVKIGIIVIAVLAALVGAFMLAGPHIGGYFQHKYYYDTYKPQELEA